MFARYAYPPNERGYCGPADHLELREYRDSGVVDARLIQLARSFEGPFPYLQALAHRAGLDDPFDLRVVEAYWVGNELLDDLPVQDFGNAVEQRFRPRLGSRWSAMAESIQGGVAHHSYHVFVTYPWVGLLVESGRSEGPLEILDRCRIRWGRVETVSAGMAVVRSQPLTWDGRRLALGEPAAEEAQVPIDGGDLHLASGDWVSLHWNWICDRLTERQRSHLARFSNRQLAWVNDGIDHPRHRELLG